MSSSLSSLCSICHLHKPHYKCPRCFTRTCSLKCSKIHKARTLCSGVRDPGVYATKKELNEAAAFDKDFNFITGVERGIESANRDSVHRGIVRVDDGSGFKRSGPARGEVPLRKSLESDGITILRAPQGMAMSRLNNTHWRRNGGGIIWTVQWNLEVSLADDGAGSGAIDWFKRGISECHEGFNKGPDRGSYNDTESNADIIRQFTYWLRSGIADIARGQGSDSILKCDQETGKRQVAAYLERALLDNRQREAEGAVVSGFNFYLEAPDQAVPGKIALISFDALEPSNIFEGRGLTLKDLVRGKTIREYPQIWIWRGRLPPAEKFQVLQSHVAAKSVKRGRDVTEERVAKKAKTQPLDTLKTANSPAMTSQNSDPRHSGGSRPEVGFGSKTAAQTTSPERDIKSQPGIAGLDYSSD